jgi:4a-hydroxytetrahydrobiopterin dehydratase
MNDDDDFFSTKFNSELQKLTQSAGWELSDTGKSLLKIFRFKNFVHAWGWMTKIAITAEKLNHHPEWSNVYGTVSVKLITHDTNSITRKDIQLANKMDEFYNP